jgi:hypothetical protein
MSTIEEYIIGRGQSIFNSCNEAYKIILALETEHKKYIEGYNYYAKLDEITNKWYIEWVRKNPNYVKPKLIVIEI